MEHVSDQKGQKYLDIVLFRNGDFFEVAVNNIYEMDEVRNPNKFI